MRHVPTPTASESEQPPPLILLYAQPSLQHDGTVAWTSIGNQTNPNRQTKSINPNILPQDCRQGNSSQPLPTMPTSSSTHRSQIIKMWWKSDEKNEMLVWSVDGDEDSKSVTCTKVYIRTFHSRLHKIWDEIDWIYSGYDEWRRIKLGT